VKFLIEGEKYPLELLKELFSDPKFYLQEGTQGTVVSVGYYHNHTKNIITYLLPKVFMEGDGLTVFGLSPIELLNLDEVETFKHKDDYLWVRQLSVYFYKALLEFKKRSKNTSILNTSLSYNLNSKLGNQEYSYLDLVLSFVNFYKKHKNFIAYKNTERKTNDASTANWTKIFRKTAPFFSSNGHPIYSVFRHKKKTIDSEEDLLVFFFSILNHFNCEHNLFLKLDNSYEIIEGKKFELLQRTGLSRLKNIKYKYFNDTLKKMYQLCELYFLITDKSSFGKANDEFISVNNFNIVFEDMIDKLFSDEIITNKSSTHPSIKDLKYHSDGKVLDHIFDYQSIIDTSNIFYIGDSKYYKPDNLASKLSQYKQFTYAKNVIQFNIDLLNEGKKLTENTRYRDEVTEGYNITPNFFIYGYIENYKNLESAELSEKGGVVRSYHFEDRLFDRDTLFVHQYMINFLFVLRSYSQLSDNKVLKFRSEVKTMFRTNCINYFNDPQKSEFELFEYKDKDINDFVKSNFRELNGKCIKTVENTVLIGKYKSDQSLNRFMIQLKKHILQ
jgi:hypothetical protein